MPKVICQFNVLKIPSWCENATGRIKLAPVLAETQTSSNVINRGPASVNKKQSNRIVMLLSLVVVGLVDYTRRKLTLISLSVGTDNSQ